MSIHYPFPVINHIDDVLPYIDDKSFGVKEKDCGNTYINYLRMGSETFPPVMGTAPEAHAAIIRRECRGIAFNTETGDITSRPFHKFFNVGESEYLTLEHFGFHRRHVVMDKLDGSMLRPIPTTAGLRWGTKAGVTDTAVQAETWLLDHPKYRKFAMTAMGSGYTPLFEFVSPDNRIVARYGHTDVILIAMREVRSGTYLSYEHMLQAAEPFGIPCVGIYDPVEGDPQIFFDAIRETTDLDEGVVVAFENGHRGKAKTDLYTTLHRIKDKASTERNLILAVLEQEIDDLLPLVPEEDSAAIMAFVDEFWHWVDSFASDIKDTFDWATKNFETKKDFAIKADYVPRICRSIVFTLWDGKAKDANEQALNMIRSGLTTETKWAQFRESLGGDTRLQKPTMRWEGKEDE